MAKLDWTKLLKSIPKAEKRVRKSDRGSKYTKIIGDTIDMIFIDHSGIPDRKQKQPDVMYEVLVQNKNDKLLAYGISGKSLKDAIQDAQKNPIGTPKTKRNSKRFVKNFKTGA